MSRCAGCSWMKRSSVRDRLGVVVLQILRVALHQLRVHRPGRIRVVLLHQVELVGGRVVALRVQRIDAVVVQVLDRRHGRVWCWLSSSFEPPQPPSSRQQRAARARRDGAGPGTVSVVIAPTYIMRHARREAAALLGGERQAAPASTSRHAERSANSARSRRLFSVWPERCAMNRPCSGAPASARSPTASSSLWRTNSSGMRRPAGFSTRACRPRPRCRGCRPARARRRAAASISSASAKVRARASSWRKLSGVRRSDSACRPIAGGGEIDRHRHVEAGRRESPGAARRRRRRR